MASAGDLDAERKEFWARKAEERRRRSSSQSQHVPQPQLLQPVWTRPKDDSSPQQPFFRPDYGQQGARQPYPKPRAMSDATRPRHEIEPQNPMRPYTSHQSDRVPFSRHMSMGSAPPAYYNTRRPESFDHGIGDEHGGRNRAGSYTHHGSYASEHPQPHRQSSPIYPRAASRDSRDHVELRHWHSPRSDHSDWDDRSYSRRHRSRSSVSHGERKAEDLEEDLRRMHPTRAYLHDKKEQYVHERPMEYPRSGKRAAHVAAGGVAGALGVAGATEAMKDDSCFGFGDLDCGLCECLGI